MRLACPASLDPADVPNCSGGPLAAGRAAVSYLAAAAPAVAEDDRSAAAPEAPAGLAPVASLADDFALDGPAASADPAQIEESPVATAFDHCDSVPADDYSGLAPGGYSAALPAGCSAARRLDVRSAEAAHTSGSAVDSFLDDYSAPLDDCSEQAESAEADSSAEQMVVDHFAPAARSYDSAAADSAPDGCWERVAVRAGYLAAWTTDDHSALAVQTDDLFPAVDCSRAAGSVVNWAAECSLPADSVVRSATDCLDAAAPLAESRGVRLRQAAASPDDFRADSPEDSHHDSPLASA